MGDQVLPEVAGGDERDAVVAVLAGAGHEQVDERRVADLAGGVVEVHREAEGIAQQHVAAAAGQADGGRGIGQQAVEIGEGGGAQGDALVDLADPGFQGPVAAGGAVAGIVAGGADIGTGPARQFADQGLAGRAGADAAAVELDIGAAAQVLAPLLEGLPELVDVVGADRACLLYTSLSPRDS